MDWQRVKEKVTEEVIRQLQEGGAASSGQPADGALALPAQAAGSAVATPHRPSGGIVLPPVPPAAFTLPACEVGPDFSTDILAIVAGPVCGRVIGLIRKMGEGKKVTVVSSGYSERLTDVGAGGQLLCEGNEGTARRLVEGAGQVVVPVISASAASQVASLIGDCLPSAVLVQAALLGKRALIARESITAPPDATWAVRRKLEEVSSALRSLGFTLTDLTALEKALTGPGTGLPPVGMGVSGAGFQPQPHRPHPAVLASRAAKARFSIGVGSPAAVDDFDRDMARMIDHTLLKPEATAEQVTWLCEEARAYSFMSVCVNPGWVPLCTRLLKSSPVKVCTVIGFPLGATSSAAKAMEATDAIMQGATEVDMVMNVGLLKSGQFDLVRDDMKAVVHVARGKALVKVILETGLLTDKEKVKACQLAREAQVDFVKTSTGFGPGGATAADIALMRTTAGPQIGVKASGGIRDHQTAQVMVSSGATRIGASASVNIVRRVRPGPGKAKY